MAAQMFVCTSVGMWWANGNPTHWCSFGPSPSHPPGPGLPETIKAEGHIFENCLQNKRCSASCKSTQAVPGTLASYDMSLLDQRSTI